VSTRAGKAGALSGFYAFVIARYAADPSRGWCPPSMSPTSVRSDHIEGAWNSANERIEVRLGLTND